MKSKSARKKSDDAQDIEDLRAAVKRNGKKPGVPWERVKKELGLDFPRSQTEFGNEGRINMIYMIPIQAERLWKSC